MRLCTTMRQWEWRDPETYQLWTHSIRVTSSDLTLRERRCTVR